MKHVLPKLLLTTAMSLATWCVVSAENIQPSSIDQSECKGTRMYCETSSEITYENDVLTLLVKDVDANCAAELVVECNADIPGEIHFILNDISEQSANCFCLFDVECKYEGVLAGHFKIFLEWPSGIIINQTEADIAPDCRISMFDPAGIASVRDDSGKMLRISGNGMLAVTADGLTAIDIYDAAGVRCASLNVGGSSNVALDMLPDGIYLIKATNGKRSESIKFVR